MELHELDRILIKDLLVRGIIGINPEERTNKQDILVNATMWADTRMASVSDNMDDSVNYKTVAKTMIAHLESEQPYLVEKLVADLTRICFESDPRVMAAEVTVEKPGALRFARSVGVTIFRRRDQI